MLAVTLGCLESGHRTVAACGQPAPLSSLAGLDCGLLQRVTKGLQGRLEDFTSLGSPGKWVSNATDPVELLTDRI